LAADYFSTIGYKCPETSNPADYYMILMSAESANDQDNDGNSKPKNEIELSREYTKKITYIND